MRLKIAKLTDYDGLRMGSTPIRSTNQKLNTMTFTITELNELIYCVGIAQNKGLLVNRDLSDKIKDRLYAELEKKNAIVERQLDEDRLNHEMNFKNAYARLGDY